MTSLFYGHVKGLVSLYTLSQVVGRGLASLPLSEGDSRRRGFPRASGVEIAAVDRSGCRRMVGAHARIA